MKIKLLYLVLCLNIAGCSKPGLNSQSPTLPEATPSALIAEVVEDDNLRLYLFEGRYLDLESLSWIDMNGIPDQEFKSHSIYANRFHLPGFKNGWPETQTYKGSTFVITEKGSLIVRLPSGKTENMPPACATHRRETTQDHYLLPAEKGVAEIAHCGNEEITVRVFDETGQMLMRNVFGNEGKESAFVTHPFHDLYFCDFSLRYLVYTPHWGDGHETFAMNLNDGTQSRYPFEIAGVVFAENELDVQGFLVQSEEKNILGYKPLSGSGSALVAEAYNNSFTSVVSGDTLFVAGYHDIATGSSLSAYHIPSGRLIWKADVEQLNVPHSQYYNEVFLSRYHNLMILEGQEAGGKYLQLFDARTGAAVKPKDQ